MTFGTFVLRSLAALSFLCGALVICRAPALADCSPSLAAGSIFFVTDREPLDDNQLFSGERGYDSNRKAIITMGTISAPPSKANETRCSSRAAFFKALGGSFPAGKPRQVLIFIHGYYTAFNDAVDTAATVAKGLHFPGPVIMYSWPSKKTSVLTYVNDETNAMWAMTHYNDFLLALNKAFPKMPISFAAHSLGGRFATDGAALLRQIACSNCFGRAVLFAPDVDSGTLLSELDSSGLCDGRPKEHPTASAPVLLYVSNNDRALRQSQKVHGHQRAGQAGSELILCSGVDTVDVSYISDSHGYLRDEPVLHDAAEAFAGVPPTSERRGLKQVSREGGIYYELVPPSPSPSPSP
jgi:esterase/lipase superfamily enzyme